MSFTDDDLKRLKEHLMFRTTDEKQADLIRHLLHRLECAEKFIRHLQNDPCGGVCKEYTAWLKSKGL